MKLDVREVGKDGMLGKGKKRSDAGNRSLEVMRGEG